MVGLFEVLITNLMFICVANNITGLGQPIVGNMVVSRWLSTLNFSILLMSQFFYWLWTRRFWAYIVQCPKIGWFGWEMTPNGGTIFHSHFWFSRWISHSQLIFGISDCHNSTTRAIVHRNHQSFVHKSNLSHIFLQIFHSHHLFEAKISHSRHPSNVSILGHWYCAI